jgi:hypothetical protein
MASKLTKAQQETLDLLRNGWELGVHESLGSVRIRIQHGGVGRGGEVRRVTKSVFDALLAAGRIVEVRRKYPSVMYGATEA